MRFSASAFPRLAVLLSLAGLVIGFAVYFAVRPVYVSTAVMRLDATKRPVPATAKSLTENLLSIENEVLSRTSLSRILQDPRLDLYQTQRKAQPLEDVIENMRTRDLKIRIERADDGQLAFWIAFAYPDPKKARQTLQALMTRFMDANLNIARARQSTGPPVGYNLDVVEAPNLPTRAVRPNRAILASGGFGMGFGLAALIAVFRRKAQPAPQTV